MDNIKEFNFKVNGFDIKPSSGRFGVNYEG